MRARGVPDADPPAAAGRPRWAILFELLFFATFAVSAYLTLSFYWTFHPQVDLSFEQIALLDLTWAVSMIALAAAYFSVPRAGREG